MLWENSSKGILMVEKIISSVVFIVWGEKGGAGGVGEGGIMLNSAESIPQTQHYGSVYVDVTLGSS